MNLNHLFIDTINVSEMTGRSGGDPTWGALTQMNARVEVTRGVVAGFNGEMATYTHKIATDAEIKPNSRVWLPGADTADANEAMRPITSVYAQSLNGMWEHWETYF